MRTQKPHKNQEKSKEITLPRRKALNIGTPKHYLYYASQFSVCTIGCSVEKLTSTNKTTWDTLPNQKCPSIIISGLIM